MRFPLLPLLVLPLALSISAPAETRGALLEKTVDVPRATKVPVDIAFEKAALVTVESINDPRESDIRDAKASDPKDATFVLLRFHYRNADYVSHKVKIRAVLMDGSDGVLAEGGRTGTMDAQQTDDTLTFPMKVKTLDWPNAAKLKVIATFLK
ncbi:MAG TPA: hypothetical protein VKF32_00610 [Thermoanaerobaculia bacterium]|nr:hypothetical protein [Thermoanaerobaculia bacterium]